jgi:hypothetical protein
MKSTMSTNPSEIVLPNWQDSPELTKWTTKHFEISQKLTAAESQQHRLAVEIEQTQAEVVQSRSSVLLGEGNEKTVGQCEKNLSSLRQQQENLELEAQALKVALDRAQREMESAKREAIVTAAEAVLPEYRKRLRAVRTALQTAVSANQELMEFESYVAKQQFRSENRHLRRPCGIHGLGFPDGIRNWEKSIESILAEE